MPPFGIAAARTIAALLAALVLAGCPDTDLPDQVASALQFPEPTDGPICGVEDLSPSDPDALVVHFIDVGQGDAIWLRLPSGDPGDPVEMLVDAGNAPRFPGDRGPDAGVVIGDYMEANGLAAGSVLDWIVVTHGDRDHYAGIPSLLDRFGVASFAGPGYVDDGNDWPEVRERLRAEVSTRGGTFGSPAVPVLAPALGQPSEPMSSPFARVEILWGLSDPIFGASSAKNDTAIVLRITVHGVRILLMADVFAAVETALVDRAARGEIDLSAEVLKVAHHGSSGSSTEPFLDAVFAGVEPGRRHAVIQSGRTSFGGVTLPRAEVVARLHDIVGPGRLLSTEHDDAQKAPGTEDSDDHVVLVVTGGGTIRLCYNPAGASTSRPSPSPPTSE